MSEFFLSLNASKTFPFEAEDDRDYWLNLGHLGTSSMAAFNPLPVNCILTEVRVIIRGKFVFSTASYAYVTTHIVKNGDILRDGGTKFVPKNQAYVHTRRQTTKTSLRFSAGDTIGLIVHDHYLDHRYNQLYMSAMLNFNTR